MFGVTPAGKARDNGQDDVIRNIQTLVNDNKPKTTVRVRLTNVKYQIAGTQCVQLMAIFDRTFHVHFEAKLPSHLTCHLLGKG